MNILYKIDYKKILLTILVITAFFRLIRLDYPNAFVFDEVYHSFTAKEYLKLSRQAWDPFAKPPEGVAFEWTHPPLAKEIMTASMWIFRSTDPWAWRLPGALLGILSIYLVYLLGKQIFKNETVGLISAFIFSIEGLVLVQSRTGMNDIYFITFILISLLFFLKNKFLLSAIFWGLALSSKWTAIYLLPFFIIFAVLNKQVKKFPLFIIIPPIIYLASYIPYFLLDYSWNDFTNLQQQMWWYHTNLKAAHDYGSPWWSWPLNLYPVWYYVEYLDSKIANIFAGGNPLVFWFGAVAILLTLLEFLKTKSQALFVILIAYCLFLLPWAFSPRIMFLYHFSPSVPFMALALGYQLNKLYGSPKDRKLLYFILGLFVLSFALVYPFLTGIPIPKDWIKFFFYTNLTKNPFG